MTHSVTLINQKDGSVQGHKADCADIKRNRKNHADEPWTFEASSKQFARESYNADFDIETDGWYEIEWLPCADDVPANDEAREPEENKESAYVVTVEDYRRGGHVIGQTVEIRDNDSRLLHSRTLLNYSAENAQTEVVESWLASQSS